MKEISILFTRHERRIESWTIGFYDLKFTHIAIYFSLMSHDIRWIHKGSSCILLSSSMSKVSCLKIHVFLIPVSSASLVRMNYSAIIYDFAYCIQTQQTILELKETES